jgi:hypothetical protein
VSRELLVEAVREEHISLKVCARHSETVYYDEPECPACKVIQEMKKGAPCRLVHGGRGLVDGWRI